MYHILLFYYENTFFKFPFFKQVSDYKNMYFLSKSLLCPYSSIILIISLSV